MGQSKIKKDKFLLRIPKDLKNRVYKRAIEDNLSVNETINRYINNSLMSEHIYFELQHLNKGERFFFQEDQDAKASKKIQYLPIYRFVSIHPDNGNFICTLAGNINKQFKYSEVFYKSISKV